MNRDQKSIAIDVVKSSVSGADGIFVIENGGITVKEFEVLCRELKPVTTLFKVVKNRLVKLALADTDFASVSDLMTRPTAIAITTDALAATKILVKFAEKHPKLSIRGGKMDAELLDSDGVIELSKLPSLDEARATLLRLVSEPMTQIVRVADKKGQE